MKPTIKPIHSKGLVASYKKAGATFNDQYAWFGKGDGFYVFSAETDHADPQSVKYNFERGIFTKVVIPLKKEDGISGGKIGHAKKLLEAAMDALTNNLPCKVLAMTGTKSGTKTGGVKAFVCSHTWKVTSVSGTVSDGFTFTVNRVF
jgi:hypothetical protein